MNNNIKLYPHNQKTYDTIKEMFATGNKAACVQPTGSGKSFLLLKCAYDYESENKVILAPTNYIFEQIKKHNDNQDIPNTTYITYAKIARMNNQEIKALNPALIVLDEFHRSGADEWGRGVQTLLSLFPDAKLLGTSATPIRYLDNERNMGDELFDGNLAVNMSLGEAIYRKIVPMPKYVSALYSFKYDADKLIDKMNKSSHSDEEKEIFVKDVMKAKHNLDKSMGIPKILKKYLSSDNGKFIVFCKNKEHLNGMKDLVIDWFKKATGKKSVNSYTVYSDYTEADIEFENFSNADENKGIHLLFAIAMLNEGVHVSGITGVVLLRPTTSPIIYFQQIGRAIDAGRVNDESHPLILDLVDNCDNVGVKSFKDILKEGKEKVDKDDKENYSDYEIDNFYIVDDVKEVRELFNELDSRIFGSWGNWDFMYERLKGYFMEHGNTDVTQRYEPERSLGRWVGTQRGIYKFGNLEKDRIEKLESLNFIWDIKEVEWENSYQKLVSYFKANGHSDVPRGYEQDNQLSFWVCTQRQNKKNNVLSLERMSKLDLLGFKWNIKDTQWNTNFQKLKKYKVANGHCDILKNYHDKQLSIWTNTQRKNKKNGVLSVDKINKLNSLGFAWDVHDEIWGRGFDIMHEYIKQFGIHSLCCRTVYRDIKIGLWVNRQKQAYKKGKLSPERYEKLKEIGIDFSEDKVM